jgi:hypothetical protein
MTYMLSANSVHDLQSGYMAKTFGKDIHWHGLLAAVYVLLPAGCKGQCENLAMQQVGMVWQMC